MEITLCHNQDIQTTFEGFKNCPEFFKVNQHEQVTLLDNRLEACIRKASKCPNKCFKRFC